MTATCFAACLPGLEPLLLREFEELQLGPVRSVAGGVEFAADATAIYRANLELGLASHVQLRLGAFHVRSLGELERKTAQLPWPRWLRPDRPFAVRATCKRSRLYHSGAVEQRVSQGIARALAVEPPARAARGDAAPVPAPVPVLARLLHDECVLSLDTSGEPLHRRGWRVEAGPAPLREDLARALVLASGWDRRTPLFDPMAGAGTILIEAAGLAHRTPPGLLRRFAFEDCVPHDIVLWDQVRDAALSRCLPAAVAVVGWDRDEKVVEIARRNAVRAGLPGDLEIGHGPLRAAPMFGAAVAAGAVVCNPPFGRRLGNQTKLVRLYQTLGHLLRGLGAGWRVALLANDRRLALRTGLPLETAFLTQHGGLKVRALVV